MLYSSCYVIHNSICSNFVHGETSSWKEKADPTTPSNIFSSRNLLHLIFDRVHCTVSRALDDLDGNQTILSPSKEENERHSLYLQLLAQFDVGRVFELPESLALRVELYATSSDNPLLH